MNERTLICITSCNRLNEVKKFIFSYVDFCNKNQGFDFLLAHDGTDHEYLEFCKNYEIPMLYSDEREGVGVSKNRVLKFFPDYDYYFFIDDDVELLNGKIFSEFITISQLTGNHHLTCNTPRRLIETVKIKNYTLHFAKFGGAYFNFFTGEGLRKVGGWHTRFAEFKRYGHTEHTYRFFNAGLNEAPFIAVEELKKYIILFNPPHVSNPEIEHAENQLIDAENLIMKQQLKYFPVETLSDFYFNGYTESFNHAVHNFLQTQTKHYPCTFGKERRMSLAEYYFEKSLREQKTIKKLTYLVCSVLKNPFNIPLKHFIKSRLFKHDKK